jgi:hypothetical protein
VIIAGPDVLHVAAAQLHISRNRGISGEPGTLSALPVLPAIVSSGSREVPMGDPLSVVLGATLWLIKFAFFSGWTATKWLTWLTRPIWAWAFGLGALRGLT